MSKNLVWAAILTRILLTVLLIFSILFNPIFYEVAFAQEVLWLHQFGGGGNDQAVSVATDSSENVFIVGSTENALPGHTHFGSSDGFVRKYDFGGNELWSRQFGTTASDEAKGVKVDSTGAIIVVGNTGGILPGQSKTGNYDAYVKKYDSNGNELWTRQFGAAETTTSAESVVTNDNLNISIVGFTYGTLPGQTSAGLSDAFIRKYDSSGNEMWTRQFGSQSWDFARSIVRNNIDGSLYMVGNTDSALPGQFEISPADFDYDAYVRKYDSNGNELWTRQFGTVGFDTGKDISVNSLGQLYIVGSVTGVLPGQVSSGNIDAYVRKYNSSGNELWTRQFGSAGHDNGNGVGVNIDGNIIIVGETQEGAPNGSTDSQYYDAFVRSFNDIGNELWYYQYGSSDLEFTADVSLYGNNIYATGFTRGAMPGQQYFGALDVFVSKIFNQPANQPPTVDAGGSYLANEGGSVQVTATGNDPENGSLTYSWDLDNNGNFETPGQTVTFPASGLDGPSSLTIAVQVTDNGNLTATDQATVNVVNVSSVEGIITGPTDPVQVNTIINTSVSFTDDGTPDTHTAIWDWGDNTTSVGTVNETNGSGTVSGSHTYTVAGVYTLNVTVTDDDGASDQPTDPFQYVVVYDPSAGFVTGAGTITSPLGAYTPNPLLTGKAIFGFVSRYQNGANVPTGSTQFRFAVANFVFQSTSYDWLVVGGPKAQYKGSGTINGSGDYGFILSSIDGQRNGGGGTDKLRIKIYDKTTSVVIYDNQIAASDTADPTTVIDSGSITIHP